MPRKTFMTSGKASETEFRTLFESAPGLYLVLLPDPPKFTIVAVTDAYARQTLTKREQIVGKGLFEIFPDNPDDPQATGVTNLSASLHRVIQDRGLDAMAVQKYDIRKPASEGGGFEERYWSPVNSPVFSSKGDISYIIHRVEDVTEFVRLRQKEVEKAKLTEELQGRAEKMELEIFLRAQEIQEANEKLRVTNDTLESFSYSVSHDLRAPLRGIDGFSQALLENYADKLDAQGKHYLQRVRAGTQRMAQLIDDILKLSRLSRSEMRKERVNLSELAKTIASELKEAEPERPVEFTIAEGVAVEGDPRFLRIVLENLLRNAWKFTGKHPGAKIELGVKEENGKPAYYIRDDGVGFDMTYASKLFGVFQRLHHQTEFPGTGIGLAIVQRIVHRHGGRIWAEAGIEKGAVFYFTLS
ncbi:MAG: PAS domain-containing sensor histidine kinase [Nitrospiria bacterium]